MNNTSISGVRQILAAKGLQPHKGLGQNFLVDRNILNKIVSAAGISGDDSVLEIGTGLGALTLLLADVAKEVFTVEIDKKLYPVLDEIFDQAGNVTLIQADILQMDWNTELAIDASPSRHQLIICANLPYYITSPIIFNILDHRQIVKHAVLMMQKEVAERLLAKPGTKEYGLLTVMVTWLADVFPVTRVSKNCFFPVPDVESRVVKIVPLKQPRIIIKNEQVFIKLAREAFQKRRKTMLNVLVSGGFIEREAGEALCRTLGIDPTCRGETLSVQDFALIADALTINNFPS